MLKHRPTALILALSIALSALACTRADKLPTGDSGGPAGEPWTALDLPPGSATSVDESALELELRETPLGWQATLTNLGAERILIVAPGDGSDCGWRTPTLDWTLEALDGTEVDPQPIGRCGNMNPLQPEELLIIEPGASVSFNAFLYPPSADLEQYHVSVRYTNDPAIAWKGGELGPHHRGAFEAIKGSTVCTARSNRVLVDRR